VAAVVAVVELSLRVALGVVVTPVLSVLFPPIVAVVGVAFVSGGHAARDGPPDERSGTGPESRVLALAAVAVVGHAVAVLAGTASFLFVDTPVRAALYWLGFGHVVTPEVLVFSPLVGVAVGTLLAWVGPAVAAVAVAEGESPTTGFARALHDVGASPRDATVAVGAHFAVAVALCGIAAVGVFLLVESRSPVLAVGVTGGLALLVSTFSVAFLAAYHLERPALPSGDESRMPVSVPRVALVCLLLVGLVGVAGAVRTAELRPLDTDPEPLPEEPRRLYATAVANTERTSHTYRVTIHPASEGEFAADDPFVVERRLDRADRQYEQVPLGKAAGPSAYAAAGTGAPPLSRGLAVFALGTRDIGSEYRTLQATPEYVFWEAEYDLRQTGDFTPPSSAVEGWTATSRSDGELVLELREPVAVFTAVYGRTPDDVTAVNASRIRAVVDTDSATVKRVECVFDGRVVSDDDEHRVDAHVTHEFDVGTDVTRPDALGSPSLGERLWKLFVY
jgi:hypothetical protein